MKPISGAELRSYTEAMGLSVAWLSKRWGSTESTIKNWMLGAHDVPERIAEDVRSMMDDTDTALDALIDSLTPGAVLPTYRTDREYREALGDEAPYNAPWHRTLCARAADEVGDVTIDWAIAAERGRWKRVDGTVGREQVEQSLGEALSDDQWDRLAPLIAPPQPRSA